MLTTALLHFAQDRRQHRKRGWRRVGPRTQVAAARRQPSLPGSNNGDGAAARWTGRLVASDPAAVPAPVDHEGSSTLVQHIKVPVHLVSSVPSSSSLQWLDSSYTAAIPSLLTTSASSMEDLRHVFHGLLVQLVLRQWRMQSMCLMVCLCSTDQLTMLDLANRDSYLTEKKTHSGYLPCLR